MEYDELYAECCNGNLSKVLNILEANNGLDWKNHLYKDGNTIMHVCILCEQSSILDLFLKDINCDVNVKDATLGTPLHCACRMGDFDTIQKLISKGANINAKDVSGCTPLFIATLEGKANIIQLLLQNGVDVDAANVDGVSPLFVAAQNGLADIVDILIQNRANIQFQNPNGATPLHVIAENKDISVAKLLVQSKADVNALNKFGWTPLHDASQDNNLEVVKFLIQSNANLNIRDTDGWTPLYIASQNGFEPIVLALLSAGSDPNIVDEEGNTPIFVAAKYGHVDVITALVEYQAEVLIRNQEGKSPMDMTENKEVKLLLTIYQMAWYAASKLMEDNINVLRFAMSNGPPRGGEDEDDNQSVMTSQSISSRRSSNVRSHPSYTVGTQSSLNKLDASVTSNMKSTTTNSSKSKVSGTKTSRPGTTGTGSKTPNAKSKSTAPVVNGTNKLQKSGSGSVKAAVDGSRELIIHTVSTEPSVNLNALEDKLMRLESKLNSLEAKNEVVTPTVQPTDVVHDEQVQQMDKNVLNKLLERIEILEKQDRERLKISEKKVNSTIIDEINAFFTVSEVEGLLIVLSMAITFACYIILYP